jgi:2-hydroxy-3-oxopropionate reductase
MKVGFVGLGRMGLPMARHVRDAGHDVTGYDIAAVARESALADGLTIVDSFEALGGCEVVCSSLPDTPDVEDAYAAPAGLLESLERGAVAVDLSTISVEASRRIADAARAHGVDFLDAPVSGTSIHAQAGTLAVMVGGDADALDRVLPVLETFSARVERVGDNGAGLQLKLTTNRLITAYLTAIAEAVVALEHVGLDVESCLDLIKAGAAPRQLDYKAGPLVHRDFSPMFTVDLMYKDMMLADETLPPARLADLTLDVLERTRSAGLGHADLAALITVVEEYMSAD